MSSFVDKVKAPVSDRMVFLARRSFSEGGGAISPAGDRSRGFPWYFSGVFRGLESGTIYNSYYNSYFKMKRELDYISVGLLRTIREYFLF